MNQLPLIPIISATGNFALLAIACAAMTVAKTILAQQPK
jgi:hypothetical protein